MVLYVHRTLYGDPVGLVSRDEVTKDFYWEAPIGARRHTGYPTVDEAVVACLEFLQLL
jgi:hypothetical protein